MRVIPLLAVVVCGLLVIAGCTERAPSVSDAPSRPRAIALDGIETQPGFVAELVYEPDGETEGSWVALCSAPEGRLFAVSQYGGLFEVRPNAIGAPPGDTTIRRVPIDLTGAQGLCWAYDALWIMATGQGLMRAEDTDDDGLPDAASLVLPLTGVGEHGIHAVIPHADGRSLLLTCGNHSPLPPLTASRVPRVWGEDQITTRLPDARGHAVGVMAPGGYVLRVTPDASEVELIAIGFRNTYDLAQTPDGEIFTYDSDMEWDLGLPWYRPTRVCHVVSGADFGWRHGSGKWPSHVEDSVPGMADIGPGSPTGVVLGTGTAFPEAEQRALYVLDWTFGIVYALHLTPEGASYAARVEQFCAGEPFPVTDAAVGDDGAMYLTLGGRGLASRLIRIVYEGDQPTTPVPPLAARTPAHQTRRQLESLHANPSDSDLDTAWAALSDDDRFIRHAARVAVEHHPAGVPAWRVQSESDPLRRAMASIAMARTGDDADCRAILAHAHQPDLTELERAAQLRAIELALIRSTSPLDPSVRDTLVKTLLGQFPTGVDHLDATLVGLLVHLEADAVIEPAVALLDLERTDPPPAWADLARRNPAYGKDVLKVVNEPPPSRQILLATRLASMRDGWTLDDRMAYFSFLAHARAAGGGMSYRGYLDRIRDDAAAHCSPADREALAGLLRPPPLDDDAPIMLPRGPAGYWTVDKAVSVLEEHGFEGSQFNRGAGLFRGTLCANCHQIAGTGANAGPDLTSAERTYSLEDLLRAIIEPSHDVSDQYAMIELRRTDGTVHRGRLTDSTDDTVSIASFLGGATPVQIPRSEIASMTSSGVSPMPEDLVKHLNRRELRDLVAYIMAGADPTDARFSR